MNPNVKVIEAARDAFPKDHYMYGALDHAAAELAVLHLRSQRSPITPPEGWVLMPRVLTEEMLQAGYPADGAQEGYEAMIAARPEVP